MLQYLNNRLEAYVLKVKEMDELKREAEIELNQVTARMQKEMDLVRQRLTKEIEALRRYGSAENSLLLWYLGTG